MCGLVLCLIRFFQIMIQLLWLGIQKLNVHIVRSLAKIHLKNDKSRYWKIYFQSELTLNFDNLFETMYGSCIWFGFEDFITKRRNLNQTKQKSFY